MLLKGAPDVAVGAVPSSFSGSVTIIHHFCAHWEMVSRFSWCQPTWVNFTGGPLLIMCGMHGAVGIQYNMVNFLITSHSQLANVKYAMYFVTSKGPLLCDSIKLDLIKSNPRLVFVRYYVDCLVQDNIIACILEIEILQSCTKPLISCYNVTCHALCLFMWYDHHIIFV